MALNMQTTALITNKKHRLQRMYPWLVISASAFFLFYKYLLQVSPSIMTHDLMHAFSITGAGLGNLAACYFYTFLVMQIPVGILLDRFSPRYLTTFAIGLCAIGAFVFAAAPNLLVAAFARALIGFGAAFATVSYMKLATLWFPPERFSIVAGLLATAAMTGAVGGEAPLAFLVEKFGWQHTLYLCAAVGVVFTFIFWLLVRDKRHDIIHISPDNNIIQEPFFAGLISILKNPQNWLLSLYSGLAFAPTDVFAGLWGVPFLSEYYQLSRTTAAAIASSAFVGLAIGAPIFGWISDYLGRRRIVMAWGTIMALICLSIAIYSPPLPYALLVLLLFFFGVGTSSFMLGFVVGKEINRLALAATVIAVINTSDALWGAISEPSIGKFLDLGWDGKMVHNARIFSVSDYHHALLILPLYLLVALILLIFIRDSGRKALTNLSSTAKN